MDSPKVYDGERTHSLSTRKRLVISPNGLWQLYLFPSQFDDGRGPNEVVDFSDAEIIAWSRHDDHELIWDNHD